MLFAVIGRFRPGMEAERDKAHEAFSEHIAQRGPRIRLGGALLGPEGARVGVIFLMESDDIDQVHRFVESSPYTLADLYERVEVDGLDLEIGALG